MAPEPPLTSHLTLDLLFLLLRNSLFHPFITLLIPLSLRACAKPYTSPSMQLSIAWSALVIIYHILAILNRRIAHGPAREVDWEEEVVVITGGTSGLGKVLAEMFGMRGVAVAVLDLVVPDESVVKENEALSRVKFYKCDVSKLEEVQRAKEAIEKDLGVPTILINSAAAPPSPSPLLTTTTETYTRTLNTNLHAHFHTLTTFLPSLLSSPTGGHIITVASVLGKLGAANLAPYSASKAGLIALHNSLTAELRRPDAPAESKNIRTILVTPGQLSTALFPASSMTLPWYAHFLGPIVEPVELAREIVKLVDARVGGEVSLPFYAGWIEWVFVLPVGGQWGVWWVSGVDRAMMGVREGGEGERKAEGKKMR